jgi:hypothetical protein
MFGLYSGSMRFETASGHRLSVPVAFLSYSTQIPERWILVTEVRAEVLTATRMKMFVFWLAAPSILVEVYRCFGDASCFYYQGD